MFALFLIICYFILIFNVIVPRISEKLRLEHDAFRRFSRLRGEDFICVDGRALFGYAFTPFGTQAFFPASQDGTPLRCDRLTEARAGTTLVRCDSAEGIRHAGELCGRAYEELFLSL
ncbi:IMV membrane protein entry/fusion complex component [Western grey kangaroopox virus]|uniref:IMV membrane protein entry/fusion complex component n=1 Tax=Western grey kangaroopox virus TaxID=1566307 RepID=A0A2C9DSS5_9POXV|nr:IMV membrane protein entry/fusion complex component [Western grey kangaroopox virus]ATI21058.1 IMV membrane protein entry/fusion complex component [Western grey kangaroopox virus]